MFLRVRHLIPALLGIFLLLPPGLSLAALSTYTSQAAFLSATAGFELPETVNFDNLAPGTLFPSGSGTGGLTFTYSLGGATIQIDSGFATTSGANYLGLDNGNGAFYTGTNDGFTLTFDHPVNAVGLYIDAGSTTSNSVAAGDFTLSTAQGSVSNSASWDVVLSDQSSTAYYLGLVATGPGASFNSVTLSSGSPTSQFYAFNVDDISSAVAPVPEPASLVLLLLGLALLGARASLRR